MPDSTPDVLVDRRRLQQATETIRKHFVSLPQTAIILGSGLGPFADTLADALVLPASDIPGYPRSTVEGHRGRWVVGRHEGRPLLAIQGRVHAYEGHPLRTIAFPIHLLAELGVKTLLITNAAGAINRFYRPGDLMVIDDHINLTFRNPLFGVNDQRFGPRFPDMSRPYDPQLVELALAEGTRLGLRLHCGVYLGVLGPSYETAAEIRMGERLGADAVGMSTVPEVITAVYRGLRVLGISCMTNLATGIGHQRLRHEDVIEIARRVKDRFTSLVAGILRRLDEPNAAG